MAEKLTPQQRAAVEDRGGKLLVSAAAGSGKTKVLVDRLMRYVCRTDDPCNIDDFLVITYTNAAAAEMKNRIAASLQELSATPSSAEEAEWIQKQIVLLTNADITTIDSFCLNHIN